jgi:hypothetical protein
MAMTHDDKIGTVNGGNTKTSFGVYYNPSKDRHVFVDCAGMREAGVPSGNEPYKHAMRLAASFVINK